MHHEEENKEKLVRQAIVESFEYFFQTNANMDIPLTEKEEIASRMATLPCLFRHLFPPSKSILIQPLFGFLHVLTPSVLPATAMAGPS